MGSILETRQSLFPIYSIFPGEFITAMEMRGRGAVPSVICAFEFEEALNWCRHVLASGFGRQPLNHHWYSGTWFLSVSLFFFLESWNSRHTSVSQSAAKDYDFKILGLQDLNKWKDVVAMNWNGEEYDQNRFLGETEIGVLFGMFRESC